MWEGLNKRNRMETGTSKRSNENYLTIRKEKEKLLEIIIFEI